MITTLARTGALSPPRRLRAFEPLARDAGNLLLLSWPYVHAVTMAAIEVVDDGDSLDDALDVRRAVFVEEQGVPADREIDEYEDVAVHLIARHDGAAVGTARLRALDDGTGKVERVAVRQSHRGDGWGRRLMHRVEHLARERGFDSLALHGQTAVEGFYESLGYRTTSDVFEEAGIPHVEMEKSLD